MSDLDPVLRRYVGHYPANTQAQVRALVLEGRLDRYLADRYPAQHDIQTDAALYDYTQSLKQQYLKSAPPLHKVQWQAKLDVMHNVLGLHTAVSRVQGAKLKAKAEIRIAGLFKTAAPAFLEMVVAHELAHLREREHNKAFYQLCRHIQPSYHQVEFDLRLLLLSRSLASTAPGSGIRAC